MVSLREERKRLEKSPSTPPRAGLGTVTLQNRMWCGESKAVTGGRLNVGL